jgi:oxygen-independent coproporphyrinogen-3 oxidase
MGDAVPVTAIYIHIPFCKAKCAYCDFNSYVGLKKLYKPYVEAVMQEAAWLGQSFAGRVKTVFVGGGTPTVLPTKLLVRVLDGCRDAFQMAEQVEISFEANPATISLDGLRALRVAGFNRISLGVQSFQAEELAMLGRIHDVNQAVGSVRAARLAGFENMNLDLIYGLPGQDTDSWQRSLQRALDLQPEHLALYALGLEPGTLLHARVQSGLVADPNPDLAARMYEMAAWWLEMAGFHCYEISNYARPGFECAHNMVYWRNQPYLGLGAGAHSSGIDQRWWNVAEVKEYISRMQAPEAGAWPSPAAENGELLDSRLQMAETMMLGLRLTREGVSDAEFQARFGRSLNEVYRQVIQDLVNAGLVEWEGEWLRLTRRGRLLGNQVFMRFLPD